MQREANGIASTWFVGYAFLWAVRLTCLFNYPLFLIVVNGPTANNFLNMSMQITYLMTALFVGVASARSHRLMNAQPAFAFGALIVVGFAFAMAASMCQDAARAGLFVVAGFLIGVGDAMLSVMWGRYFVGGSSRSARTQMPLCLALGVLAYFLVLLLPRPIAFGTLLVLPVLSGAFLRRGLAAQAYREKPAPRSSYRMALDRLLPSLLCVMACALVFGLIGQVALTAPVQRGFEHIIPPVGIAAAGFLACLLAYGIRKKVAFDSVYRGVFGIASVGLFLLPFLGENYSVLFNLFVVCAYYLTELYFFYYAVEVVQDSKVPAYVVYGLSHGAFCAMTLLGIFLSVSVFSETQYGTVQLVLIAFVSAYLLGMGLIIALRRRALSAAKKASEAGGDVSKSTDLAEEFSAEHGFSQRETEVFSLLVVGRTARFIADAISLSPSTVKGHVQNVYRKCDVHTRQELIDEFEQWKGGR